MRSNLKIILKVWFYTIILASFCIQAGESSYRSARPCESTGITTICPPSSQGTAVCCPLPRDVYITGDLTVGGTIFADGSFPGGCSNTLYVKKGELSSPFEFNSLKAAVDSIATNSAANRFIIHICPGIYVEDTVTLKPYVTIAGASATTVIIQASDPSQSILIGAPNALVGFVTLQGSTDPGSAAVAHSGGAAAVEDSFILQYCVFGANDICVDLTSTQPGISSMVMNNCTIRGDSGFSTGISMVSGPFPAVMFMDTFTWLSPTNPSLSNVLFISGPDSFFIGRDFNLGSSSGGVFPGNAIQLENGASLTLTSSNIGGFTKGIFIPNTFITPPILQLVAVLGLFNTEDLRIDHAGTTGSVDATFSKAKVIVTAGTPITLFLVDPEDTGIESVGPVFLGRTVTSITDISPLVQQGSNMGVIFGEGMFTAGAGLTVDVDAGSGYLMTGVFPTDDLKYVEWTAQAGITLTANADNFIFIDSNGVAQSSVARPTITDAILIGKARTNGTDVVFVQYVDAQATHTASLLDTSWRQAFGGIYVSGSIVSASATVPQLDVSNGDYFFSTHEYFPLGGNDISFLTFSRGGANFNIGGPQQNVPFDYDSAPNTLTPVPPGMYAKQAFYVVGGGGIAGGETYILQYGQELFPTLLDAQNGGIPPTPGSWTDNIVIIASIIVDDTSIVEIIDERPRLAFKAGGVTVVTNHGDLTGLLADDHPQYLLVNGSRAMAGSLNLGTNNVVNAGTYNGVTVQLHGSRHLPAGADPLTTAAPVTINTVNSIGAANSFSRSDHVHAHGAQTDPTLHAVATAGANGFMSAADKTKLDAATPLNIANTLVLRDGAGDFAGGNVTANNFIAANQ